MNNKFIYSIIHLFFEDLCIVTCDLKDVTMWEKYCSQSINFCEPAGCPGICIYSIRKKKETFPAFIKLSRKFLSFQLLNLLSLRC